MKRILIIVCIFLFSYSLFAQKEGTWSTHFSYMNAITQIAQGNDLTYVLTDGKLYSYSKSDTQTQIYVKNDGGDNNISQIAYDTKNGCLIIFRNNADIDLLYSDGHITNIPDLKNATQNIDKTLNSIFTDGDYAYLSTNFGLMVLNLAKEEVAETGIFKTPFYAICSYQNKFYAATQNGVLTIDTTANILNLANWTPFPVSNKYTSADTTTTFNDSEIRNIGVYKNQLHFFVPQKAIYVLKNDNSLDAVLTGQSIETMIPINNNCLLAFNGGAFWNFTALEQSQKTIVGGLQYVIADKSNANQFWTGIKDYSLSLISSLPNSLTYTILLTNIRPDGPLTNFPFFMRYDRGALMLVGGGFNYDNLNNPAQLSVMTDGKWFNYDKSAIDSQIGFSARDFTSVIADPTDINHLFVASWGDGLYEFKDQKFVGRYLPSNTQGVLEDIYGGTGYVRMNGMAYDASGNLWLTNAMVPNPLKVMEKGGTWLNMDYPIIAKDEITNNQNLMIDQYNNKWLATSKMGTYSPYIFISNNNTTSNTSGDKTLYVNSFSDQNGNKLNVGAINETTEDRDGNIWVSTDIGPFIVYNSSSLFDQMMTFYTPEIPRNDGSNDADILLQNAYINKIIVDGGNRKWIATQSSGVYLVSADGSQMIHHFNTDNSPLPSNNVLSLAIDSETGVVYIGTDAGIVSFVGDATSGNKNFSGIHVFPNPVRPDYTGNISIVGLESNSIVKITDINGNIIAQGQSLGGSFIWNGTNKNGTKVSTGVYLVFATSADGSAGTTTKIMVIK